jgi:RNA polymerase sigma-70 factor (ECF subfamily)
VSYSESEMAEIYNRNVDMIYRISFSFMKNQAATEDCVQDTFLRIFCSDKRFESTEHEKAWLIKTAQNVCKDQLKRKHYQDRLIDDWENSLSVNPPEIDETLEAVLSLPSVYRVPVYLFYYEEYDCKKIAKILKKHLSPSEVFYFAAESF